MEEQQYSCCAASTVSPNTQSVQVFEIIQSAEIFQVPFYRIKGNRVSTEDRVPFTIPYVLTIAAGTE